MVLKRALLLCLLGCLLTQVSLADDADSLSLLIDRHIQAKLDAERLPRAPQADDAEFLRRITLDLHGVVPSAEPAARFLNSDDPRRRALLIDELLGDPRFGRYFAEIWSGYLISPIANEQRLPTDRFAAWLADRFNQNLGWDQTAFDLLTAAGTIDQNPAVLWLIEGRFPLGVTDLTDLTSRYFLGVRLNCAQCHDHPFVDWKQTDYWGMAAFFAQIQMPGRPKKVYLTGVRDDPAMSLALLHDSDMLEGFRSQPPTFLGGDPWDPGSRATHRAALARWITSPENPWFARAMVNRMWWHFFGRGLVNPVDDMHSGNAPSHPELLDLLSRRFADSGFDLKFLCRAILNTRTYQQTSRPGERPDLEAQLFARMSPKVLTAEQLYDSLVAILGQPDKVRGIDARLGTRGEFIRFFASDGDPDPLAYGRGIPHALRLMNSPQFGARKLDQLVARLDASTRPANDVIDGLFLTILARRPSPEERRLARNHIESVASSSAACRELAWALLMTSEFSLNH